MLLQVPFCYSQSGHASYDKLVDTEQRNFFIMSKDCTVRKSAGALQGTNHSVDSTGYLCFADVFCKKPYEMIFLYKNIILRKSLGYDSVYNIFDSMDLERDTYSDFDCFVFDYPHSDPETQDDIHEMNIHFPITVSAYKRTGNTTWHLAGKTKVRTFEEFSEFQFRVIYNLVPYSINNSVANNPSNSKSKAH